MGQLGSMPTILHGGATIILLILEVGMAVLSLYLLILAVASFFTREGAPSPRPGRSHRFAILIPAHNEEALLGSLIQSLKRLDYPDERYDVHVVADNCTDATVEVGRRAGAHVHDRIDPSAPGKGHALNWLIGRLTQEIDTDRRYDAFVVLDADSVVTVNFLAEMNAKLCAGHSLVQSFNDVANPTESWTASLRYIAFCLICYLRPLGRSALGLSVGLRGNGMCLSRDVVERFPWNTDSPAEDHELHMRLLLEGLKVAFAPRAHVYSEMPTSLRAAQSQNIRWERGKIEVMLAYSPRLLLSGIRTLNWSQVDGALELMVPPFSLAVGLALLMFVASLLVGSMPAVALATFVVVAQLAYTIRGITAMPLHSRQLYLALLYAPWFITWKAGIYLAVAVGAGKGQWVRTTRSSD